MTGPVSDLDIRFEHDGTGYKTVVVASPAGEGHEAEFESPFNELELENFALRMQRGGAARRIESPQAAEAKQRGDRLFRALFRDDLLTCLHQSLVASHAAAEVLRIRLRLGATPELANLPWEYLYDKQHNRFLCLSDRTPVVRYAEMSEVARPLRVSGPLTMLVMVSSPTDYPSLDVDDEWAKLNGAVADLLQDGLITVERLPDASLATLRRSLRRREYHVFHFIGHGGYDTTNQEGVLIFTADDGRGQWVSGERLGIDLGNAPTLRLAVLNACEGARSDATDPFSGVAQSLVQQGVPAVVAMQYEISDRAAVVFARGFYSAVSDGLSIEASMGQARRDVHDVSELEWATPVLYLRCAESQLFQVAPTAGGPAPARTQTQPAAPPPPPPPRAGPAPDLVSMEIDALSAFYSQDWDRAVELFEQIVTMQPDHPDAPARLAEAHHHRQLEPAAAPTERAAAVEDHYADAIRAVAASRWTQAQQALQSVVAINATYRDTQKLLAVVRAHLPDQHQSAVIAPQVNAAVDDHRDGDREPYRQLVVFPEDVPVPAVTVARLWDVEDPGPTLARLDTTGLLTWRDGTVTFDESQRATLLSESGQPPAGLHRQLLAAHRPARGWGYLADDEPYLWDQLLYHLEAAGEHRQMAEVVTDGRWLVRRLHRDGVNPTQRDITRAAEAQPHDRLVAEVLATLRRRPGLFARGLNVSDLAATVISRLPEAESGATDLLGTLWLQPAWPLHEPTGLLCTLDVQIDSITAVSFAPDGRRLASASEDCTLQVWDTASGACLTTMTGHTKSVNAVAFAPDGITLASGSADDTVREWDAATGACLATFTDHDDDVTAVAFAPDGRYLASASDDETVLIWDRATGACLHTLNHDHMVNDVAFAPDGRLASASDDETVVIWDPASGSRLAELTGTRWDSVTAVAFAPDGRRLASAHKNDDSHTVRLWDPDSGAALATLTGHTEEVKALAFAPDGRRLASASDDGTVRLWDPATAACVATLDCESTEVNGVAFAPDGRCLATTGICEVRLWDTRVSGQPPAARHTGSVNAVAFSPDGRRLASASHDHTIMLWDSATGAPLATLTGHTDSVAAVAFSSDGRYLASASWDNTVRLWDATNGSAIATLTGHTSVVSTVAFALHRPVLASAGWDNTLRLWDADLAAVSRRGAFGRRGPKTLAIWTTTSSIQRVAFSPDRRTAATANKDGTIQLLDVTTGAAYASLTGHTDTVNAVDFAPDGRTLASASDDGTVRVWDAVAGTCISTLTGHEANVDSVSFAPDGRGLASSGSDSRLRVWDSATSAQLASLRLDGCGNAHWAPTGETIAVSCHEHVAILRLRTRTP